MRRAGHWLVLVLSLGVTAYAVIAYAAFPIGATMEPSIRQAFESHAWAVYAHVFAAVTLRLWLPGSLMFGWRHGLRFEMVYPVIAWLCWVPNLLVAEWLLRGPVAKAAPQVPTRHG